MPYKIIAAECSGCSACESECPNDAIKETDDGLFGIKADKCTECVGHFDEPQCVAACPADCVKIDKSLPRYQAAA